MSSRVTNISDRPKRGRKYSGIRDEKSGFSGAIKKKTAKGIQFEGLFRKIFSRSSVAMSISSLQGDFIMVNPALCAFLGYCEDELLALGFEKILHPDDLQRASLFREEAKGETTLDSREERYLRRGGKVIWGQTSETWIVDDVGKPECLLTWVQEIGENNLPWAASPVSYEKLALRVKELEAANMELESFNYTLSHDLRSPLASIGGFCDLLLGLGKSHLDEQCKSIIRHMRGTVRHMDQLVEALLNFSLISECELQRDKVDLSILAITVAALLRMRDPHRHVNFEFIDKAMVEGDAKLLREVMENLIGNAWKYTSATENARIEFGSTEIKGEKVFFVRDNGPGFDNSQAERVFIPFHRLHSREEFSGHGIGLSTVQRIVNRHGGRVWAEGKPGQGATFFFTLPEKA